MTTGTPTPTTPPDERRLDRALTVVPATAVILANIIGTGVFVKARVMTVNVGTPATVLAVWLCAGLLTLTGALVYAELGTMMPRSGGAFHFIGAAFGRRWAYLYGWTYGVALGASVAAVAILFVTFLNDLTGAALPDRALTVLPLVTIVVATALNLGTVRSTGRIATALTAVKVAIVLGIGVGAFVLHDGSWAHLSQSGAGGLGEGVPESARGGFAGFGAAMLGALWSYNGWAIVTSLGGEVKDPARTLPRTLVGGTLIVIALYMLVNAAYFYVLTPLEIADLPESRSVANATVLRFAGSAAAAAMSAGLVISAYGTLHTTLLVGSRVPYALARKGLLPAGLGRLSARSVPAWSVLVIGGWGLVLALTGTFDILTDIYIFMLWIFYGLTGLAVFVLRRRMPDAERPVRTWGYPVVPALFLLVTLFLLVNTFLATPARALWGVVLVVTGLPVYAYYARRLGPDDPADWLGAE